MFFTGSWENERNAEWVCVSVCLCERDQILSKAKAFQCNGKGVELVVSVYFLYHPKFIVNLLRRVSLFDSDRELEKQDSCVHLYLIIRCLLYQHLNVSGCFVNLWVCWCSSWWNSTSCVIYWERYGAWAEITHSAVPFVVFHACQLIRHDPIQSSDLTFIHN